MLSNLRLHTSLVGAPLLIAIAAGCEARLQRSPQAVALPAAYRDEAETGATSSRWPMWRWRT